MTTEAQAAAAEQQPTPPGARPYDELRDVLTHLPLPVQRENLRTSYARLAAGLIAERDCEGALNAVDSALAHPGPDPSGAQLHALRAAALLVMPDPDLGEVLRSALVAATGAASGAVEVVAAVANAVTPAVAQSLRTWTRDTWLPAIRRAVPDTQVRVATVVLAAVMQALDGQGSEACRLLRMAIRDDAAGTRAVWSRWLADVGAQRLATLPGGAAYAGALRARAEMELGDQVAALALADEVIAAGTAAPLYGELEAYWLRADLTDRPLAGRAADYVQVGMRLTWRGRLRDLDAALDVFERAIECDAQCLDAYWGLSEAHRLRAVVGADQHGGPASAADLNEALAVWNRGRAFGPPTSAWAWLVRGQLFGALARAEPARAGAWRAEALGCAAACTLRFPDWSAGWAALSRAFLDARIWAGAGWAARRCTELVAEWNPDTYFEAVAVCGVLTVLDPLGAGPRIDELPAIAPVGDDTPQVLASFCATIVGGIGPVTDTRQNDWAWTVWSLRSDLLAGRVDPDVGRAELVRVDHAIGRRPELLTERALVRILLGDLIEADALLTGAERGGDDVDCDPVDLDCLDLYLGLLVDGRGRHRAWPSPATAAGVLLLTQEIEWLRSRVPDPAELDEVLSALEAGAAGRTELPSAEPDAVVHALDHAAAALTDSARIEALMSARSLAAGTLKQLLENAADLTPPVRLVLGPDLVPADAGERWSDWSLFTRSLPGVKSHLRDALGVPVPGIRVVESTQLAGDAYAVEIDGQPVRTGTVPGLPPRAGVSDYADTDVWRSPVAAVEDAVRSDPSVSCLPSGVDDLLTEWRDLDPDAWQLAEIVSREPRIRVRLWQWLRETLVHDGRVPSWTDGLRDEVAALVAGQGQQ